MHTNKKKSAAIKRGLATQHLGPLDVHHRLGDQLAQHVGLQVRQLLPPLICEGCVQEAGQASSSGTPSTPRIARRSFSAGLSNQRSSETRTFPGYAARVHPLGGRPSAAAKSRRAAWTPGCSHPAALAEEIWPCSGRRTPCDQVEIRSADEFIEADHERDAVARLHEPRQEELRSPRRRCWSVPSQRGAPVKELGGCLQTRRPPPHLGHGCSGVLGTTNRQQNRGE
jgi:hypothetical protein